MRDYTYLLLNAAGAFVGVVRQNVAWEPVDDLVPVELPEEYAVRRRGEGWEVWTDLLRPTPLSEAARAVVAANHIPVVFPRDDVDDPPTKE
jgi:hypothetical protein